MSTHVSLPRVTRLLVFALTLSALVLCAFLLRPICPQAAAAADLETQPSSALPGSLNAEQLASSRLEEGETLPRLEDGETLPRLEDGETLPRLEDGETLPAGATDEWWATVREHIQRDDYLASTVEERRYQVHPLLLLDPLGGSPDWTADGEAAGDWFGGCVATAGDVDGDGYADVIIGAYRHDSNTGRAYLYLGGAGGLSATPVFTATGEAANSRFGKSVGTAGDVDGDGYADVIIGSEGYNSDTGRAYLYSGSAAGLSAVPVFTATGEVAGDFFGRSAATAGDVDGDGYADVIVGAHGHASSTGRAYLFRGGTGGLSSTPVFTATGQGLGDQFGSSVATAGDVDADRYADVIIGARGYNSNTGRAYVYRGDVAGLSTAPVFTTTGQATENHLGYSVATAGDVNGDGYADVIVGAWRYNNMGRAYVYAGGAAGPSAIPIFVATAEAPGNHFGVSVATGGDVNGDGYADVLIGAESYNSNTGRAYLYLGSASGLSGPPAFIATGEAAGNLLGGTTGVATAGDVNGDGYADILIGAVGYSSGTGRAYAYYGGAGGLSTTPVFTATGEATGNVFGVSVSTAGDVNGDGYADVIVGAYGYNSNTGRAYVYHGGAGGLSTAPSFIATGEAAGDQFGGSVGSAGDVDGNGYADVIIGAPGYSSHTGRAYVYRGGASGLSAAPVFTASGEAGGSNFGGSVSTAGDVDGDGYADVIIAAEGYDSTTGRVYVYRGGAGGLGATPAFTATGEATGDSFGISVGSAGDVDADGFAEIIIGAYGYDSYAGRAYVYRGGAAGLSATPVFTITGDAGSYLGVSVGTAGDAFGGDSYADVIVGAYNYDSGHGRAYVYRGGAGGLATTPVFTATGEAAGNGFGCSAGTAGDVDGDGYADVIIGASGYNSNTGRAYVYRGGSSGLSATPAFTATGEGTGTRFGRCLGTAGDVNGDGFADVIVGSYMYGSLTGRAYVYAGNGGGGRVVLARAMRGDNSGLVVQPWTLSQRYDGFEARLQATDPLGRERVKLQVEACPAGAPFGDGSCSSFTSATWEDVTASSAGVMLTVQARGLISGTLYRWRGRVLYAPFHVTEAGIMPPPNPAHGPWRRFMGQALEADLRTGMRPLPSDWLATGEGTDDSFGNAVATAGDVDGDGYADVIVGAPGYDNHTGRAYLYRGSAFGLSTTPIFTATGEGSDHYFGNAVGTAGDVDGDGYADVIIGAYGYGVWTGRVYVYCGGPSGLSATPVFTATGETFNNYFGCSAGSAGDVEGDGYADVIVGAYGYDSQRGRAYLYRGGPSGLSATPVFTATGEATSSQLGYSVASAGDVDGDGYADVIIGAYGYSSYTGRAYVYRGGPGGLSATPDFVATGEAADNRFGMSVAAAGDAFGGDGYADIVIGAYGYNSYTGRAYVYRGGAGGLSATPDFIATGEAANNRFGISVGPAGDMDGDGYADFIVGAEAYDSYAGRAYVYRGGAGGLSTTPAFSATGEASDSRFGRSVGAAGDVNGDGYADVVVGAWNLNSATGRAYAYYGHGSGLRTTAVFTATGQASGDRLGNSVATAGDVNGDGYADVIVGAYGYSGLSYTGRAYVYLGGAGGLSATPIFTATGQAANDLFGYAVGTAGDVNGDGYADVIVGARNYNGGVGRAYVYRGSVSGVSAAPVFTATGEASGDLFGVAVGTAGDVDGDGYAEVIIGAYGYDSTTGRAYLYRGSAAGLSTTPVLTLTGEGANCAFGGGVGTAGDVNGDGYADVIIAAGSYDSLRGRVYVYGGGASGLSVTPVFTATGFAPGEVFGSAVGTAGDVDADGYSDVVIGAYYYNGNTGRAYLYRGGAGGLSATPVFSATGSAANEYFGNAAGTAGDAFGGDGYADLIIAAGGYNSSTGRVYVYRGGAGGLSTTPAFTATGEATGNWFGGSARTAGDVNGDGFADIIVGADAYNSHTGRVYVYGGGGGGGRTVLARALRGDDSKLAVQPWTLTQRYDGFEVRMRASDAMGRERVKLQAEACPPGVPFGDGSCSTFTSATWEDVTASSAGVTLTVQATGLISNTVYRWRGRVLYAAFHVTEAGITPPPNPAHGPWRRFLGQALEADVRTGMRPPVADWVATGEGGGDKFGTIVASAGDVDGDGYADVIVGAPGHDSNTGRAYLYRGTVGGISATPAFTATGEGAGDSFGCAVACAGDVDGDGYTDVVIGAQGHNGNTGRAYVYAGSAAGLSATPVFTVDGQTTENYFGGAVGTAGDVNGDGYAEVIIGAYGYNSYTGRAYVYQGGASGLSASPVFVITGQTPESRLGGAVGTAGDVNGDGYADVIVGAWRYNSGTGRVYVFRGSAAGLVSPPIFVASGEGLFDHYGASAGTAGDVDGDGYADVIVGAEGYTSGTGRAYVYAGGPGGLSTAPVFTATGEGTSNWFGRSVSTLGDLDGDGYADVIVGGQGPDSYAGRVYVYCGGAGGLSASPAFTASGEAASNFFGLSVARAGDVNGDGYGDILVGARGFNNNTGRAYAYYGQGEGLTATPVFTASGEGTGDQLGYSVATAGDVDGDGFADVIVGAYMYSSGTGRAYVYRGSAGGLSAAPIFTATGESTSNYFGCAVATAGDVDGDGYADVIIGAYGYDNQTGRAYVYRGSSTGLSATPIFTATGEGSMNWFGVAVGTAGDTDGDGYADVIIGAQRYSSWTGRAYLYRGGAAGLSATPSFTVTGQYGNDLGVSVGAAGDVNGDGYGDVIIGAQGWSSYTGRAYVYACGPSGLSATPIFTATGEAADNHLGGAVSTAGDVNGDGYAEVIVGARGYSSYTGRAYIYYGGAGGPSAAFVFTATGETANNHFGQCVGTAGDLNGDGYADIIIGADRYSGHTGRAYAYHGGADGLGVLPVFTATGQVDNWFGLSLGTAGDVNGDGFSEVVIGARGYSLGTGRAYVYAGGGGGDGRAVLPRARRADDSAPLAPGGQSISPTEVRLAALAHTPFGRSQVRLQWEVKPEDTAFDGTALGQSSWQDSGTAGYAFNELLSSLSFETRHHWRVRIVGRPSNAATNSAVTYRSRWLQPAGNTFFTALSGQQAIAGTGQTNLLGQAAYVNVGTQGTLTGLTLRGYPQTAHEHENNRGLGSLALDRYFTITPNGDASDYNLTLCLNYDDAELGSLLETDLKLCRWTGTGYSCLTRSAASSTSLNLACADNVTQLSDWVVAGGNPTAVTLLRFAAVAQGRSILITWETSQEVANLGFNLYRANTRTGSRTQLNEDLIPVATYPGSPSGAVYHWTDQFLPPTQRTFYYWLESVDIYGLTTMDGPVQVALSAKPAP